MKELCGYLGLMKVKNTKKIWWSSEHPLATGRMQKCDIISVRMSCLTPNYRANNIENIKDTFHLYFDKDIMGKIVNCTKTIARFLQSDNLKESSKYTCVKKVEIDVLFGLLLQRNTWSKYLTVTGAIMSKNCFRFLKDHICLDNPQERTRLWERTRFEAVTEI